MRAIRSCCCQRRLSVSYPRAVWLRARTDHAGPCAVVRCAGGGGAAPPKLWSVLLYLQQHPTSINTLVMDGFDTTSMLILAQAFEHELAPDLHSGAPPPRRSSHLPLRRARGRRSRSAWSPPPPGRRRAAQARPPAQGARDGLVRRHGCRPLRCGDCGLRGSGWRERVRGHLTLWYAHRVCVGVCSVDLSAAVPDLRPRCVARHLEEAEGPRSVRRRDRGAAPARTRCGSSTSRTPSSATRCTAP